MGILRKKQIRGEDKYYWIISKRQSKKQGGTGKVKKIEYYLGDDLDYLDNLSWYLWNNDIKIQDFIDKLVRYHFRYYWIEEEVVYYIKNDKIYFQKVKINTDIDLRQKIYIDLKETINRQVTKINTNFNEFQSEIFSIINYCKHYNECIELAHKSKKDTDYYFSFCNKADQFFQLIQWTLKSLLNKVPKTQREIAKDRIWGYCLRKCPLEKLDL